LVAAILTLAAVAVFLPAREAWREDRRGAGVRQFQELVRGLGLGPAATPSGCEFGFDPRVSPDWRAAHDPVVCGEYFCPGHAGSVFYLAPLEPAPHELLEGRRDADVP
jgi:hypothetical protein